MDDSKHAVLTHPPMICIHTKYIIAPGIALFSASSYHLSMDRKLSLLEIS
jgi:hypothetical protein